MSRFLYTADSTPSGMPTQTPRKMAKVASSRVAGKYVRISWRTGRLVWNETRGRRG